VAPPRVLTKIRGYFDEQGTRWLTVTEAVYVYNHVAVFPISDATWRRRCRSGIWTEFGVHVAEPMPGYWMTDSQTLYEFLKAHNEDVRVKLKTLQREMARERREFYEEGKEP
jgi:hypothetical protein